MLAVLHSNAEAKWKREWAQWRRKPTPQLRSAMWVELIIRYLPFLAVLNIENLHASDRSAIPFAGAEIINVVFLFDCWPFADDYDTRLNHVTTFALKAMEAFTIDNELYCPEENFLGCRAKRMFDVIDEEYPLKEWVLIGCQEQWLYGSQFP